MSPTPPTPAPTPAPTNPVVGDKHTLEQEFGVGDGCLAVGAVLVVADVVSAGSPGVGATVGEDVVIFEVSEPGITLGNDGIPVQGTVLRRTSLPVSHFLAMSKPVVGAVP